jgi:hypothetical protein
MKLYSIPSFSYFWHNLNSLKLLENHAKFILFCLSTLLIFIMHDTSKVLLASSSVWSFVMIVIVNIECVCSLLDLLIESDVINGIKLLFRSMLFSMSFNYSKSNKNSSMRKKDGGKPWATKLLLSFLCFHINYRHNENNFLKTKINIDST